MTAHAVRFVATSLTLALAITACSRHGASSGAAGHAAEGPSVAGGTTQAERRLAQGVTIGANNSFARITYRPEVKTIEGSGFASTLVGVSPDGHTLVFHDAPADIRALKAGDVMLIKNELARKVLGAEVDGEETFVVTDTAMLADLITDGEINVDAPLIFSSPRTAALRAPRPEPTLLDLLIKSAYAQGTVEDPGEPSFQRPDVKGPADTYEKAKSLYNKVISGWTVAQMQAGTSDNVLNYHVVLVKNVGGFIGKVAASGTISNFRFWSHVRLASSIISDISVGMNQLGGQLHFDWEVAKGTPGSWNQADPVKLPGALSIPLAPLLSGLPLTLEVSQAIMIHPALTGGNQVQTGGFTITVNQGSNLQASISKGGAVAEGSSIDQTFQITNDTGISAVAPDAMVIAYAAPRFELQLNPFGSYGKVLSDALSTYQQWETRAEEVASRFAPNLVNMWKQMGVLNGISNVLKSKADVYAQLVSSEGAVHAPTISMVPCSKKWIEFSAQVGTAANIAGMTPNATRSTTVFSKKYSKADPPSNFCEKVGS
jgi:hypothetical protein